MLRASTQYDPLAVYDWCKPIRKGNLVVPESVGSLAMLAELVVDYSSAKAPTVVTRSGIEIVFGFFLIIAALKLWLEKPLLRIPQKSQAAKGIRYNVAHGPGLIHLCPKTWAYCATQ
jgi:hypothetical protein